MAGNITIVEPGDNFQKVSKAIIFNKDVDVLTLGVYVKILTLGKKWQLNVNGLASILNISTDKIRRVFATLEQEGYLKRSRTQGDHGRFTGWDYFISSVPFTDIAKTPTSEKTDIGENRISENTDVGEKAMYNIDIYNNTKIISKDIDNNTTPVKKFDFRRAMIEAGVDAEIADAWLQVRKARKAVNSEIAWKEVAREIAKSGRPANECIRQAVAQSWRGFKAEWIEERQRGMSRAGTAVDRLLAMGAELYSNNQNFGYDEQ